MKQRIIVGYVCQVFDDDGTPSSQSFISSSQEVWKTLDGEPCDAPANPQTFHMDMEQPGNEAKLREIGHRLTDMVESRHGVRIEVEFDDPAATMKRLVDLQMRLDVVNRTKFGTCSACGKTGMLNQGCPTCPGFGFANEDDPDNMYVRGQDDC